MHNKTDKACRNKTDNHKKHVFVFPNEIRCFFLSFHFVNFHLLIVQRNIPQNCRKQLPSLLQQCLVL